MNLRTLKKLSKKAAPLLYLMGDSRDQFLASRENCYHGILISDQKHWSRSACRSSYEARKGDWNSPHGDELVFDTRAGRRIVMRPPCHPRRGTVMVGCVSGYYEPEWSEETTWEALRKLVISHFEVRENGRLVKWRVFRSAGEVLTAAREIVAKSPKMQEQAE